MAPKFAQLRRLYDVFIGCYSAAIGLASLWNAKARAWRSGRRQLFDDLSAAVSPTDAVVWMHCASAGEFEQGKPLLAAIKAQYPQYKRVVSFFSPSGYMAASNDPHADVVTYLPLDTKANAERFLKLLHPDLVIFVKYEFWYHHLAAAAFHHIPVLLVSGVFRPGQVFFRRGGRFLRQLLFFFRRIFVQNAASVRLLQQEGIAHCQLAGDTRFDRVAAIAKNAAPVQALPQWAAGQPVLIAGSTWPGDEALLQQFLQQQPGAVKLVIAPHEVDKHHLQNLATRFPGAVLWSTFSPDRDRAALVLIIDNIGLLSRLYAQATICYVGGGFTRDGIHNVLEAAVWGKPVLFGPNYKKYAEAVDLLSVGGGFTVANADAFGQVILPLLADAKQREAAGEKSSAYVQQHTGATEKVMRYIQENRLLTRL